MYGVHDTGFHDLSDSPQTQYVLGRAIPEYANKLDLAPPLVLAITQELNHGGLEPTSTQVKDAAALLARTVHAFCTLCQALAPQFQQIGYNRDKALKSLVIIAVGAEAHRDILPHIARRLNRTSMLLIASRNSSPTVIVAHGSTVASAVSTPAWGVRLATASISTSSSIFALGADPPWGSVPASLFWRARPVARPSLLAVVHI